MASKRKAKPKADIARECDETAAFVEALETHGQLQKSGGPMKPGATHVLKKAPRGKTRLVRKRFSAI